MPASSDRAHPGRPEHSDHGGIAALLKRTAGAGAFEAQQVPGG